MISAALIGASVLSLVALSLVEARWLKTQPWSGAIRTEGFIVSDTQAIPAWSRELSLEQSVGDSEIAGYIQRDLVRMAATEAARSAGTQAGQKTPNPFDTRQMLDLSYLPRASVVMLELLDSALEPLLASGRLPVPGSREVLAGPLLSSRDVELDGEAFTVVGRLNPQVRGFVKTYVLPASDNLRPHFSEAAGARPGSVVVDGMARLRELVPALFDPDVEDRPLVHMGPVPTLPIVAWGVWLSLLCAAVGASLGFITLARRLAQSTLPVVALAMRETVLRPRLLIGLHLFLFGAFFGAMVVGMRDPELNYLFTEYAAHTFTDGGLKYVGDAYQSGSIPRAAHATYLNNFVYQTACLTAGLSLIMPVFAGVLKVLASFLVVGFAMAPLWTETASGMTYHVITLVLELPPYVLAAFGVSVWCIHFLNFVWSPVRVWYLGPASEGVPLIEEAAQQLPRGLIALVACTLLSGIMLYGAAWYEAVTLILFR